MRPLEDIVAAGGATPAPLGAPDVAEGLRLIAGAQREAVRPVYVDLDGTLVATDLLWESLISVLRHRPWLVGRIPWWWGRGRVRLKRELAAAATVDVTSLPYRAEVIQYLERARQGGARVVLATAADEALAREVAEHLQLFDGVLATNEANGNLKGKQKLRRIEEDCRGAPFFYFGDSAADTAIFEAAAGGVLVGRTLLAGPPVPPVIVTWPVSDGGWRTWLRALRWYQWVKNLLVLLPVATSHRLLDGAVVSAATVGLVVFSLMASGNYLLNDLWDLPADRRHPTKRLRPLASGRMPVPVALGLMTGLWLSAASLTAVWVPRAGWPWVAGYFVLANWYSLRLKQLLLVDVMVLAGLYTLRILAGGAVTGIPLSEWLVAFSLFLFTSLAFVKRFTELKRTAEAGNALRGRAYEAQDLDIVRVAGPVSGYAAILVMALYINSPAMRTLYSSPHYLWMVCPLLTYWITRIWFLANRGELDDDPIVFALKDPPSYVAVAGSVAAAVMASAL